MGGKWMEWVTAAIAPCNALVTHILVEGQLPCTSVLLACFYVAR